MDKTVLKEFESLKSKHVKLHSTLRNDFKRLITKRGKFYDPSTLSVSANMDYMGKDVYLQCSFPSFGAGFTIDAKYDKHGLFSVEYNMGSMRFTRDNTDVIKARMLFSLLLEHIDSFELELRGLLDKHGSLIYALNTQYSEFERNNTEFMREYNYKHNKAY